MKKKKKKEEIVFYFSSPLIFICGFTLLVSLVIILNNNKFSLFSSLNKQIVPTPIIAQSNSTLNLTILNSRPEIPPKETYINMAIDDLGNKLRMDKKLIKLEKVNLVDWSDTSLGCPEKDMMYAQVIIPGYEIEISALGKIYFYHAGSNRVVTCR